MHLNIKKLNKNSNLYKLSFFLFISLYFFVSCSSQVESDRQVSEATESSFSRVEAGGFFPGQLEAHFLKHRNEFGEITQEQYLEQARDLLNASVSKDILEKNKKNRDILHYRVSTGEFAVMTEIGRIRTYFKADYRYWLRQ